MPFTRKLNVVNLIWQVFWLALSWLPSHPNFSGQWLKKPGLPCSKAYSYGDSAGFTPDFPFNPVIYYTGTKSATNVGDHFGVITAYQKDFLTRCSWPVSLLPTKNIRSVLIRKVTTASGTELAVCDNYVNLIRTNRQSSNKSPAGVFVYRAAIQRSNTEL